MLPAGTCVFKVLSKKQVQNLKAGSLEEGLMLVLLIPVLLETALDPACGGAQDQFYAVWLLPILGKIITW